MTGKAFADDLKRQLKDAEIEVKNEKVGGVYALKDKFVLTTHEGNTYEGKTVILACGVESVKQVEGEEAFTGRGLATAQPVTAFCIKAKPLPSFAPRNG